MWCRQMAMSLGAVCWCRGERYISTKCTLFQIIHQTRSPNIIRCHDNNIWKQICIKNLSCSTDTYLWSNIQRKERSRKIYMSSISQIGHIPKKYELFYVYHIMISKGTYWAGPRLHYFYLLYNIPTSLFYQSFFW